MIIRKELDYENTFIRGDVIDFEKGYSKHGTFLRINNRLIDCGYIEENTLNGTRFKFVTMEEEIETSDKLFKLKDLLKCKPRLYYLMTTEQKRELEEAKRKRCEGKFGEALQLHIDYCHNNIGRVGGEVFEELSLLMTVMGYYDLGLCFLSLANLSEIQVYCKEEIIEKGMYDFDSLKKIAEYQYMENKSEKLDKKEEEEIERLRGLVKELVGENARYGGRLKIKLVFRMQNIDKLVEGERFALKLVSPKGVRWISKELLNIELKNGTIYIEEKEIKEDESGDRFKRFYYEYCLIENEMQQIEQMVEKNWKNKNKNKY